MRARDPQLPARVADPIGSVLGYAMPIRNLDSSCVPDTPHHRAARDCYQLSDSYSVENGRAFT